MDYFMKLLDIKFYSSIQIVMLWSWMLTTVLFNVFFHSFCMCMFFYLFVCFSPPPSSVHIIYVVDKKKLYSFNFVWKVKTENGFFLLGSKVNKILFIKQWDPKQITNGDWKWRKKEKEIVFERVRIKPIKLIVWHSFIT